MRLEPAIGGAREPSRMARLTHQRPSISRAQCGEEGLDRTRVIGQAGRQLHQHTPEFFAQATDLMHELGEQLAGFFEAVLVREQLRRFHREAERRRHARRPPLVGLALVRLIEARIDFHGVEARRVALEMRAVRREQREVFLANGPAGNPHMHHIFDATLDPVFVFFSNRLGCLGSIAVSIIGTAILLMLMRSCA